VRRELGVECLVEVVAQHTLPRTSSGKLSRAGARRDYIARLQARVLQRRHGQAADVSHSDSTTSQAG
jgi:fatty-acyl-CoA synthase